MVIIDSNTLFLIILAIRRAFALRNRKKTQTIDVYYVRKFSRLTLKENYLLLELKVRNVYAYLTLWDSMFSKIGGDIILISF